MISWFSSSSCDEWDSCGGDGDSLSLDDDDARSFHWVAYASVATKNHRSDEKMEDLRRGSSTKMPIGTIRLVPPPQTCCLLSLPARG